MLQIRRYAGGGNRPAAMLLAMRLRQCVMPGNAATPGNAPAGSDGDDDDADGTVATERKRMDR